mgnify:CR=1 FL=1
MKLAIVCPKCSFRITSDLEHAINSGVCPKCGTEIDALKGEHKENIGVVNMFISACKELNLPLSPQQILDLINKYFKEKAKLLLPDFELDIPLSQKLAEMETALGQSNKEEEDKEEPEVPETPKPGKKPKKIPKMKNLSASSTPGIAITEQEAEDTLNDLAKEQPLVAPPSQEDYSESGFSFGNVIDDPTTGGRGANLNSIRQRIQQYKEEE